ncbi:MAG: M1 family peptidase [Sphingobacteriales bacterium]|nr:MAG: M1 family peptidase [Sphingobacteriales bacterium]
MRYTAKPYASPTGGSAAIKDDRGLYFINTDGKVAGKPRQIWTQGETQANSHWMPTVDQPNERFTMRLELTVPDSFVTLSNGSLELTQKAGNKLRRDVWVMNKPIQTYAYMFAVGDFVRVEDSSWRNREISYYTEPAYAPYATGMFRHTPEMVEYFSRVTGVPYPWNKYSQIVVRDYVSGAMENTTASLFGEFMNQNFRELADKNNEDVVSHELFHQWFGDYVTAESWSNLTVNESFANFGEQLWREFKYGRASADELAFDDLSRYIGQAAYNDDPLVRFHYHNREVMFDRISYQKGGAILRYMRGLMGEKAFSRAMQIYLTKNALQSAEAHNWRMAVEEATGQDWTLFFNQWYFRGGHPELNLSYNYDDSSRELKVSVVQTGTDSLYRYHLPLQAGLIYGSKLEVADWKITKKKEVFSFPYNGDTRPVFIPDFHAWPPGVIKEKKVSSDWLAQFKVSNLFMNKRRAITGAFLTPGDAASREVIHAALRDSLDGIRSYTLSLLQRAADKNKFHEAFRDELIMIAMHDGKNKVRAAAFDVLGAWKTSSAKDEMLKAINDSSYMVAGAALNALDRVSKDTAYTIARSIARNDNKAHLEAAVWKIISARGEAADFDIFSQKSSKVYGQRKISFAQSLNSYLLASSDMEGYRKSLELLTELAANESISSYRYNIGSKVAGLPAYLREQIKSATDSDKKALLGEKLKLAEQYRQTVISQETDPENLGKYNKNRK